MTKMDMTKKRIIQGISLLFFIMVGILFAGYYGLNNYANKPLLVENDILFSLPSGASRTTVAQLLSEQHIIESSKLFPWLLRTQPSLSQFKAGTYQIKAGMTLKELLLLFKSGKEYQFSIQFIEGTRLKDWLLVLNNAPYIKHTLADLTEQQVAQLLEIKDAEHPEGWLYPNTYLYTANTEDIAILKRAHQQMKGFLNTVWFERDDGLPYKNPYELLIMASIIEKETSVDEERDRVASVFVNRLRKGMRLQTDPTVIYGMGDSYQGVIRRKDLDQATVYNTYVIFGFPPTPIAMPGLASLKAAAHPAKTQYLYFVADGYGKHVFTTNLQSHNQAVRAYRQVMRNK